MIATASEGVKLQGAMRLLPRVTTRPAGVDYRQFSSRSLRTASLSGFFAFTHILDGPLR